MGVLQFAFNFETTTCCECNLQFAMSAAFYKQRREKHDTFYCPAGHSQYFSGQSDKEKLQKEIEHEKRMKQLANEQADRNAKWAERRLAHIKAW